MDYSVNGAGWLATWREIKSDFNLQKLHLAMTQIIELLHFNNEKTINLKLNRHFSKEDRGGQSHGKMSSIILKQGIQTQPTEMHAAHNTQVEATQINVHQ